MGRSSRICWLSPVSWSHVLRTRKNDLTLQSSQGGADPQSHVRKYHDFSVLRFTSVSCTSCTCHSFPSGRLAAWCWGCWTWWVSHFGRLMDRSWEARNQCVSIFLPILIHRNWQEVQFANICMPIYRSSRSKLTQIDLYLGGLVVTHSKLISAISNSQENRKKTNRTWK